MANALGYDLLQNGVVASGDLAQTLGASSITNGGTVTYSIAAATAAWVKDANSALIRITPAAQNSQTFSASITSTKYVVYGIEIDPNGVLSAVKGAETATQLNTGSLIASNSPATTSGKMRIMDIAIRNNAGTYQYGDTTQSGSQGVNWIDRRPWARGVSSHTNRQTNASAGIDYTVGPAPAGVFYTVDATNLQWRLELSGVPLRIRISGSAYINGAAGQFAFGFGVDGAAATGTNGQLNYTEQGVSTARNEIFSEFTWVGLTGSHVFLFQSQTADGTHATIWSASANLPLVITIEELVRQNTNNGTA